MEEETRRYEALVGAEGSANAVVIPEFTPTKLKRTSTWRDFASKISRPTTWRNQSSGSMDIVSTIGIPAQSDNNSDTARFLPEIPFPIVSKPPLSAIPAQLPPTLNSPIKSTTSKTPNIDPS